MAYTSKCEICSHVSGRNAGVYGASREVPSEEQCYELLTHIAENPECGDVMPGTGGVRKLRWSLPGRGKRGGARVIYFYHDQDMPILLITMYPKNVKRDLSQAEKNELKKLIPVLVSTYKSRRRGKK
jgi:hypothetical protein